MARCTCGADSASDYLDHQPACPVFREQAREVHVQAVQRMSDSAARLEELADRLSKIPQDSAQRHQINNVRQLLMGESFRMRKAARNLGKALDKGLSASENNG